MTLNNGKKEWLQNRANEIAKETIGHEFNELGAHLQMMCYLRAEQDYIDRYASLFDEGGEYAAR